MNRRKPPPKPCAYRRKDGKPCGGKAQKGSDACGAHQGKARRSRAYQKEWAVANAKLGRMERDFDIKIGDL